MWCWDITWLPGPAKGLHFYLYLILDIFSRKIVGWEIHDDESAENASMLIRKAHLKERVKDNPLVLHSDNGSPMKGSSMLETLYSLGVVSSFNRPRVAMIMLMLSRYLKRVNIVLTIRIKGFQQ